MMHYGDGCDWSVVLKVIARTGGSSMLVEGKEGRKKERKKEESDLHSIELDACVVLVLSYSYVGNLDHNRVFCPSSTLIDPATFPAKLHSQA